MRANARHPNDSRSHLLTAFKRTALALAVAAGFGADHSQALTTTSVIDLGPYNTGTYFPPYAVVSQISQGTLPPGSILRGVALNYTLESGEPYLGDLALLIADSTADNGVLLVAGNPNDGGFPKDASTKVYWDSGGDYSIHASASASLTAADGIPAIDLNAHTVWLEMQGYDGAMSGSITLTYDVDPALILNFGPGAVIDRTTKNISWTVPYGTNITALAPTFTLSSGTCNKNNGGPTTYDFTNPVSYTVTDGDFVNTYTVTVHVTPASSAKNIVSFGPGAVISGTDISWIVGYGTDVTHLSPTYSVSTFAAQDALYPSGTTRDFTNPQTYTITAQDLTTQTFTVTVSVAPDESTLIWDVAGDGAWDHTTPNWRGQTYNLLMPFFDGKNVIFNKPEGGTISIDSGVAPLSTTVSADSGIYTFSGQPVTAGSLVKSGGGQLTLNVTPSYFGSILVQGGSLYFNAADHYLGDASPVTIGGSGLTVKSGASIEGERAYMAGSLTMDGGTWWEDNGFGGSWTGPVYLASDSFFGRDGWCCNQTILGNISGPGGFTFSSQYNAVLGLFGTNSYYGPTIVNSGLVSCQTTSALGHTSALSIAAGGAQVLLAYTGDHVVSSLILGGVSMPPGTYGSSSSPAANQNDTYFATNGSVYSQAYTGTGTVTVVPASGYATWAGTNAPTGTAQDDYDGDGVSNGVEYVLGGTKNTNDLAKLPSVSAAGGNLVFTFVRDQASIDGSTSVAIEVGTDLVTWPDSYSVPDGAVANNPGVTVVKGSPAGFDTVTLTVPQGVGAGKFARLKVVAPTP